MVRTYLDNFLFKIYSSFFFCIFLPWVVCFSLEIFVTLSASLKLPILESASKLTCETSKSSIYTLYEKHAFKASKVKCSNAKFHIMRNQEIAKKRCMLLDLNDTSQTSQRWNDGWRPSKIIAYYGQRTVKTPQKN